MLNIATKLDLAVRAVCPDIVGVRVGDLNDRNTWSIEFSSSATSQQRQDALSVIAGFDPGKPSADDIKNEARRRIVSLLPEWKQANMTARGVELLTLRVSGSQWSQSEQGEAAAIQAAWAWVRSIRAASNELETTRPADFASDTHWPAPPMTPNGDG